jgi:hypothetical protein
MLRRTLTESCEGRSIWRGSMNKALKSSGACSKTNKAPSRRFGRLYLLDF